MRRKKRIRLGVVLLVAALIMYNIQLNRSVDLTYHLVSSSEIPTEFDGYTIAQVSDFHSSENEKFRKKILDAIRASTPDVIVITGDLVDAGAYAREAGDIQSGEQEGIAGASAADFAEELIRIAPVYYIYGNHEMILLDDPDKNPFKVRMEEIGVQIINNRVLLLERDGATIQLAGIQDPSTLYKDPILAGAGNNTRERTAAMMEQIAPDIDPQRFTVLLAHRPEYVDLYARYPVDLVLAGHAHGGQIRLPFMREGLYAPNQGLLPKYTNGSYRKGALEMIVSRGLGNSIFPFRFLNQPELVFLELTNNTNSDKI